MCESRLFIIHVTLFLDKILLSVHTHTHIKEVMVSPCVFQAVTGYGLAVTSGGNTYNWALTSTIDKAVTYTNWGDSQPDNLGFNGAYEDGVEMLRMLGWKWNDVLTDVDVVHSQGNDVCLVCECEH